MNGPSLQSVAAQDARNALAEDVGSGDLTASLIDASTRTEARVLVREPAIVCGRPWVEAVLRQLDPALRIEWQVPEGARVRADDVVLRVTGSARTLLTAERSMLNFLQLLSGVATRTAQYVQAVEGTRARIVDTRKTLPGLRVAQKYAVRVGGGANHRMGLYDGILIKENHIAAAGGITEAVRRAKAYIPHTLKIEVETETVEQVREALAAGADIIMLDNMDCPTMRSCVELIAGRAQVEASGGVNLDTVRAIAETGVDIISIGALTHSPKAADISMLLD